MKILRFFLVLSVTCIEINQAAQNIPERKLAIQQGFNEKYDTENFLQQMDDQLDRLNKIDSRIKNFKQWVQKKTDGILYHMEHNNDMSTPNLLIKMLYAKKMIEVALNSRPRCARPWASTPASKSPSKSTTSPRKRRPFRPRASPRKSSEARSTPKSCTN